MGSARRLSLLLFGLLFLLSFIVLVPQRKGITVTRVEREPLGDGTILGTCVLLPEKLEELTPFVASLKSAGMDWIQTDIPLSRVNPAEGVYHFNYGNFEEALKVISKSGLKILLKFLGQGDWISRDPAGPHSDWDPTLNLTPPSDRNRWMEVVRTVVKRYGPYCRAWQIGNEPDGGGFFRGSAEDYLRYLEWTGSAIKSVQPKGIIVGGELFLGDTPLFRLMLKSPHLFDVLSVHYPLAPPEHAAPLDRYTRAMREVGVEKPIWNTEQLAGITCDYMAEGTTTHIGTEGGLRLSPLKAVGHCLALGIEKIFLFSWNYDKDSIAYRKDVQRECLVASQYLQQTTFVRKIDLGSRDLTVYLFRKKDGKGVLTIWTEVKGVTFPLILEKTRRATIVTHKGKVQAAKAEDGRLRVLAECCPKVVTDLDLTVRVVRE
ncbi:MAG: hypothetical protein NZ959_09400 [Armatimonadetes bacterium]|nr:hypothetical protein [Armatimonadota bacterium]MDW8122198.1 hypothetical protein [Armatimonadota bacterium]